MLDYFAKKDIIKRFKPRKFLVIRQYEQSDCGPAALLSVLKYYGGNSHLIHMRDLCRTTSDGTTIMDMINAAQKLGFEATGVKGKYENLFDIKLPCIVHVTENNRFQHFLIIYKITQTTVTLGDPANGLVKYKRQKFEEIWKSKTVILLDPTKRLYNQLSVGWFTWIIAYLREERLWLYQSLFLGVIYTILGLLTALLLQHLIDRLIPTGESQKIRFMGIVLLSLFFIKAFSGYLRERFLVIFNKNLSIKINAEFIDHLFKLPKKFFDSRKRGDITSRIHDIVRIQQAVIRITGITLIDIFVLIGSLVSIYYFSNGLGWMIMCFSLLYILILLHHSKSLSVQQSRVMKGAAAVESAYIDSLEGMDDILGYNASESFSKSNKLTFELFQNEIETLGFIRIKLSFLAEISAALITTGVLIYGALEISTGWLQIGEMIACYSLLTYIMPAVNRLIEANISLQGAFIAIRRMMELLLVKKEKNIGENEFIMKKSLTIHQAKFSWKTKEILFDDLNLKITKGKIVSVWGPSGVGKSTLVQLIHRKYIPDGGKICIDGKPVDDINLIKYRQNIGVIPQHIKIFNGTIAENILLGRPASHLNELNKLIDRNTFFEFFNCFDSGLYTLIGESNRHLSGGEKQMLGLARALLNYPEILIIDEGINAIDIEIEKYIFRMLTKYVTNHAVLINTHNLRVIKKCDYLYVMKEGRIIQKGTPNELLKKDGYFKSVFIDT